MIVVRNVFKLKFGAAKPAVALWKEYLSESNGMNSKYRLMTDLTGDFYTLVFETTYADMETFMNEIKDSSDEHFAEFYSKFVQITESGYREIFSIVDQN